MYTIKDVAREAGVAVGTVSNVINNKPVKEITKLKVEQAIKKLNYKPDIYARGFKMQRTNTVALILPSIWNPFFSEFAYHVEVELSKHDIKLILCNSDARPDKEIRYINMVKQNKMDGIIGITYSDIDEYISAKLPIVSIDRHFSEDVAYVTSDNFNGGRMAVKELIKAGCKKLAYVGTEALRKSEIINRKKGFIEESEKAGIEYIVYEKAEPIDNPNKFVTDFVLDNFIKDNKGIDGIFAINDFMALRVIKGLEGFGKIVPRDVQVIGYDGIRMAQECDYVVSTIRQPIQLMAQNAVKSLMGIINNENIEKMIVLPVEFIKGHSTL